MDKKIEVVIDKAPASPSTPVTPATPVTPSKPAEPEGPMIIMNDVSHKEMASKIFIHLFNRANVREESSLKMLTDEAYKIASLFMNSYNAKSQRLLAETNNEKSL